MSNKKLGLALLSLSVLIIAGFGFYKLFATKDTTEQQPVDTVSTADRNAKFTESDVAKHNSKTDCWTIIEGNVYDLTSYINRHPGGSVIAEACGIDGSELFKDRGGRGPHPSSAKSDLENLKIGSTIQ